MAEEEVAVKQNIKYKNVEDVWAWANPITIYKDGTIKLNGSLTNLIDASEILLDHSITSIKMFGDGEGQDADNKDNDAKRPVTTNTIQNQAITGAKIYPKTITNGLLYDEENDDQRPVTNNTIKDLTIEGTKINDKTIPMKKLSEPLYILTPQIKNGQQTNDHCLILYYNEKVNSGTSEKDTWKKEIQETS